MCHLRHRLRIFLFHRKVMFCSQDIQVFVFLTIPWFIKSVTPWWVLEMVHFWIYLLNHNSLTHQTWSVDRYKQGQYISENFWMIWRTGAKFQVLFKLANNLLQLLYNQLCQVSSVSFFLFFFFFFFLKIK